MNILDDKKILEFNSTLLFSSKEEKNAWWRSVSQNAAFKLLLDEIRVEANRLLIEKDPELPFSLFKIFAESGSRLEYEKAYFEKRRRLNTFAIMVLLEPTNIDYLTALENIIWSICNEYSWCLPAHLQNSPETSIQVSYTLKEAFAQAYSIDLFAAETAFSLAEILRLTEEYLNPIICKRINEEVFKRILHPFKENQFGWEKQTHNWAAVCAGSIGSAALHLIKDPGELALIVERVLPAMDSYLTGFNEDGICLEGYGYWQYGFGYYVYFADLLKKRTAGKLNLFDSEKVHQIALFQQRCFLSRNLVVNFSDAQPTATVFLGLSHYLSKIYNDFEVPEQDLCAKYTEDHCSRWAPAIRNLLWFDETALSTQRKSETFYSEKPAWFISRHQSESGCFSFAAKGGHNDEPHNHNDIGHFILQGNNEVFLKDLGAGLYTKDYFNEKRYTYLCNGSQGHSVPIINHQFQKEGPERFARISNASLEEKVDTFKLDMANAYEVESLQKLSRTFTWIKRKQPKLILEDNYTFTEQPDSIIERFIIPSLSVTKDGKGVILEGQHRLRILYDKTKLSLAVRILEFENHFGKTENNSALDFIVINPEKDCSVKLAFQFE
ncbi:heparinase II/III-family protein [Neobacillus drentensis]|uniref:heparinase II/III family protein n=1 Tax=Neobacillus drentensis TaxID=220684 RepID=UPI001F373830|nr:heparinase II/III family protein [Neobacillus drentensis]ULT57493.1 heparinase II/III-family protein [Neobacillus drentensis]